MHRLGTRDLAALLKALVASERGGGDARQISNFYVNQRPGDPRRFPMEMEMAQRVDATGIGSDTRREVGSAMPAPLTWLHLSRSRGLSGNRLAERRASWAF
jgi:hypothetical protein